MAMLLIVSVSSQRKTSKSMSSTLAKLVGWMSLKEKGLFELFKLSPLHALESPGRGENWRSDDSITYNPPIPVWVSDACADLGAPPAGLLYTWAGVLPPQQFSIEIVDPTYFSLQSKTYSKTVFMAMRGRKTCTYRSFAIGLDSSFMIKTCRKILFLLRIATWNLWKNHISISIDSPCAASTGIGECRDWKMPGPGGVPPINSGSSGGTRQSATDPCDHLGCRLSHDYANLLCKDWGLDHKAYVEYHFKITNLPNVKLHFTRTKRMGVFSF